ncbi:MAG TPA: DUF4390 domain-containing protein [Gemmatimonadales bacterium]|nr:DUF4390 domain-containing protein [Gemmatimonadales bacterium]
MSSRRRSLFHGYRRAWQLAAGIALAAAPLQRLDAQEAHPVRLYVTLSPDSSQNGARAPIVRSESLLGGDSRWLTALRSGLPVRLHYRVEVWRSREGWFDIFVRQAEWDLLVRHEPLLDQYTLLTFAGASRQERRYATLDALGAALAFAYQVNVRPTEEGRYYYAASLQVSTLSDSDLDDLERFLAGDLRREAKGRENLGDALGRGATRFLLRLAGLPSLRLEARSDQFVVP